jgi:predicted nucleotidyltransferase
MVKKLTKYSYLEPFLNTREILHLAEISKKLKQPHPTTRIYLNYFEKKGILKKESKGKLSLYKLNLSNNFLINYLAIIEQEKLLKKISDDLILNEVSSYFINNSTNQKILIFGSAVDNSKKANDVDILVIGKINIKLKELENIINKKIHLINVLNFKEIKSSLKEEILNKHLIIKGAEEISKWLV